MTLLIWAMLVLLAGWIGYQLVQQMGRGVLIDITMGVLGALFAGWLFSLFQTDGTLGFNEDNILIDTLGIAAVMLFFNRSFRSAREM